MDLKKLLVDMQGNPIKRDPVSAGLTMSEALCEALVTPRNEDAPDLKLKKYRLFRKLNDGAESLTVDEKSLALECAGKSLVTLVYGQIYDELNS